LGLLFLRKEYDCELKAGLSYSKVVFMLFFKTVDSRDAVNKATWMYLRRVLRDSMEATNGLTIAM